MKNVPLEGGVEDIAAFRSGICRWALASSGSTRASSGVTIVLPTPIKANPLLPYRRSNGSNDHSIEVHDLR
jgi:hypothetical protein